MRIAFAFFVSLAPGIALAQAVAPPLPVEEAVAQAVKNHPRLSAAVRDVVAARSGVRSANALANPEVVVTPGLSAGGSDEELNMRQPLEINGTRAARTGVATARLRGTQAQAVVELRNLVSQTKVAYYGLARARDRLALALDLLKAAEEFDRIAHRQVELGSRPGIDATQTAIEGSRARQQVIQAESEETAARAALNTQMGRDPTSPVGALSLLPYSDLSIDREAVIRQALAARSEITVEEAEADGFRQEARQARAEGLPDLAPQFRATSITRGFHDYGVGVGIVLPLLDYGSRRNRIRQAEESARAQADRVAATRNEIRREVEEALVRLSAAGEIMRNYEAGLLDQSRRLLDASRIGFQEGRTSITAVLEAQRTFRAVQSEYTNAQADYSLARAELERATGAVPASLLPAPRR